MKRIKSKNIPVSPKMKKFIISFCCILSVGFLFYNVASFHEDGDNRNYKIDIESYKYVNVSKEMNCIEFYNKSYLLDAFYDERIGGVRVFTVGILKKIPIPKLLLVFDDIEVEAQIEINLANKYTKLYGNYLLRNKDTSKIPKYVRYNDYKIPIIYYPENTIPKYNNTLCIDVFINYTSVNHFIQVVESNIHFGVDRIVIYKASCSKEMEKVLNYYEKKGIIDVITWNLTIENGIVKKDYFGQLWKLNDCFYRYRRISKHIIVTDLDEILWSENKQSSNDLELYMNKNKDCSAFYFRQRLYHREILNIDDRYISNLTDADIFAYREYCELKKKMIQKYLIYNTNQVSSLEIHFILGYFSGFKKCYVPIEIAYARHYRRISYNHLKYCSSPLIMESKVSNDEKEIQRKVELVKNDINIHPSFSNNIIILKSNT